MVAKLKGLGRGLDAIFDIENKVSAGDSSSDQSFIEEIEVSRMYPNPKQPRTDFDEEALQELADSISSLGIIQPITVKKDDNDKYMIISGERRWRASKLAGLNRVPVYIREADDQLLHEMSLVENIQRKDLNAMEIAISLNRLMEECDVTQESIATRVGKKRSTVANYLRLLSLPAEVQLALKRDLISMGHAKAIASVQEEDCLPILSKVVKKGLSVRQTEELVKNINNKSVKPEADDKELPDNYTKLVEEFARIFSEDIKIKKDRTGGGKIIIGFASDKDIEVILEKIGKL